jgi:hypothetical protein
MRVARIFLLFALILGGVLTGVDYGLRAWTQEWLSDTVSASLALPVQPEVEFTGFPFTYHAVRGRFPTVTVEAREFPVEGGPRIQLARVEFEDVGFSLGDLLGGNRNAILRAGPGTGRVEISDIATTEFVQSQNVPIEVEFLGPRVRVTAVITAGGRTGTATAVGPLLLVQSALVFAPDRVKVEGRVDVPPEQLAFQLPLPGIISGLTYESLTVEPAMAVLQVKVAAGDIRV